VLFFPFFPGFWPLRVRPFPKGRSFCGPSLFLPGALGSGPFFFLSVFWPLVAFRAWLHVLIATWYAFVLGFFFFFFRVRFFLSLPSRPSVFFLCFRGEGVMLMPPLFLFERLFLALFCRDFVALSTCP